MLKNANVIQIRELKQAVIKHILKLLSGNENFDKN
jgi:hypothetical protein